MNYGARELASNGPNLVPVPEVALLELPGRRPSSGAIGCSNDGTPIGIAVHRRSDTYRLFGCAGEQNPESVADLKGVTCRMGRIDGCPAITLPTNFRLIPACDTASAGNFCRPPDVELAQTESAQFKLDGLVLVDDGRRLAP